MSNKTCITLICHTRDRSFGGAYYRKRAIRINVTHAHPTGPHRALKLIQSHKPRSFKPHFSTLNSPNHPHLSHPSQVFRDREKPERTNKRGQKTPSFMAFYLVLSHSIYPLTTIYIL